MSDFVFYVLLWIAVSVLFGLFVCPRLLRKAPGGNP